MQNPGIQKKLNKIILDTDIGPDCDDAGALAVLHSLAHEGSCEIAAVMHCTTNRWGAACADAINTYFDAGHIPVGTLKGEAFLDDDVNYYRYNKYIALNYPNKYVEKDAEDAVGLYKKILGSLDDKSVVLIAIGPLRNLKNLLYADKDIIKLIEKKISRLVIMGGSFGSGKKKYVDVEWNIQMDIESARMVVDKWPGEIVFCGVEIGYEIISGKSLKSTSSENPVRKAYELHSPDGLRYSWDPLTVLYGVRPDLDLFTISSPGRVSIDKEGHTDWSEDACSKHRYIMFKVDPETVACELERHLAYR